MRIPKKVKRDIKLGYNYVAKKLYGRYRDIPSYQMRLMIMEVVTSHVASQSLEAVTSAKRLTNTRLTRAVNQEVYLRDSKRGIVSDAKEYDFK